VAENHITPIRALEILQKSKIAIQEMAHVRECSSCNGWMRALAAIQSTLDNKSDFEIPPSPDS
jgi:hypothetical protein